MVRLGTVFDRARQPEELIAFARDVETLGLDELWVVEDCFWTGGLTAAMAALMATDRLRVGLGVAPAPLRSPALLAMEFANVARLAPGRFTAGIGHGVQSWMAQVGERADSPLTLFAETVTAVRTLLRGEEVTTSGRYLKLDHVTLVHPPRVVPPIVCGVVQPRSLRLSGRLADGTILCEGITPSTVGEARAHIDAGRQESGRTDHHEIIVFAYLCLDDDPKVALAGALPIIDHVAGNHHRPPSDDMVIWGTAAMAAEAISEFGAAGVDSIALRPVGPDPIGSLSAVLSATMTLQSGRLRA